MATPEDPIQANYATNATDYNQFLALPLGTLEQQLFTLCIPDCSNLRVLDLGGGTGNRARDALAAGATSVDVVDISPDMMRLGQEYEESQGRGGAIKWYHGDASKDLEGLGLETGAYDLVIANGVFDHARSGAELEMMWRNTAGFLKGGGMVVANRNYPASKAARRGKYGVELGEFEGFDGGFKYRYRMLTEPVLEFESMALDVYYTGSLDVPGVFFEGFANVPWEETEIVKKDREFWREFLEDPILYIFTARKKM